MDEWMSWMVGGGADTGKEGGRCGMDLYKTQLSLSSMEKIKAHDRYKHICYSVTVVWRSGICCIYTGRSV